VTTIVDHFGTTVRLTDERLAHILEHPEMSGLQGAIAETLKHPVLVVESLSDEAAHLYYRFYSRTRAGDKFLCVVVKIKPGDAFVLTAYLTDSPKKGAILWSAST
jgi:hypothetical protein